MRSRGRAWWAGVFVTVPTLFCTGVVLAGTGKATPAVRYDREVRPILSDNCFKCHGPDDSNRQGGLRLDRREDLFARRPSGAPVVPGKPEASRLWVRIVAEGSGRMPPLHSGKNLTPTQKQTLRTWIQQGAPWTQHWAFTTPQRPVPPRVNQVKWVRNDLDRFVLARLEREGLPPAPEADRVTLLRRLSLDLTGLPPTPTEIDAFLVDRSANAYEKQVDRLLASPHYGERWAAPWLDAARYADSDGFEKDKPRSVYFYRDWVVNALNRDLPYNQFLIDQLAGDLLPNATQDQRVATGFLRNSMINEEGGVDPEQFRMEAMFDRMDAIGKGMLGLTVQCAQCHTHKYDPLTQEEYYRLFAFLNNSDEGSAVVYTPEGLQRRAEILRRTQELENELRHKTPDWESRLARWEAQVRANQPAWTVVKPELDSSGGQKHYVLADGSILAQGYAPTKHTTEFTVPVQGAVRAVRLELLNDPNLLRNGPGRSIEGLCALTEFKLDSAPKGQPSARSAVAIASATADVSPEVRPLDAIFSDRTNRNRVTGPVAFAIDGKDETAWGLDIGPGRSNVPRQAVFVLAKPIELPEGGFLTFRLTQNHGGWNSDDNQNNNLGRFRFSVTDADQAVVDPVPASARDYLAVPPSQRTPGQVAALFSAWRLTVPEWKSVNDEIERLWKSHPPAASQLVLSERMQPRPTSVLERGDFLKPKKPVQPGVPAFLHPLPPSDRLDRLALARWIADPKSPTTARSIVNRIWQGYFGTGLTRTSEDLGLQSETPSHPELLDYLAASLVDASPQNGLNWSLKRLHRLIVGSATYRQSSRVTAEKLARDPDNRLLSRGARFRVDAEGVRDIVLAASGLLETKIGGPPVFPPAPSFLFLPPASYGPKTWPASSGSDRYRRALYTFRYRSVPYPSLQVFDAPNGDQSCVRRTRSNTPLQALTALNEPVFVDAARALARKALLEGGADDAQRIAWALRRCIGRVPTPAEVVGLREYLQRQRSRFQTAGSHPGKVLSDASDAPVLPKGVSDVELAAWTLTARVMLNLDETITRE